MPAKPCCNSSVHGCGPLEFGECRFLQRVHLCAGGIVSVSTFSILTKTSLAPPSNSMWIFGVLIPSFVLVGSTSIAALCNERRPLVLLCLGGMVGMVLTGIVLSIAALLLGIAVATWVTLVLLVSGSLAGAVYWWKTGLLQSKETVSWKYIALLLVLAGHFGLVAAVSWQFAAGAGGNGDNLFVHSAYTTSIARGNYPAVNPYRPDQLLAYRLPFHLLAAFVTRLADQSAPEVLAWLNAALFAILFLGVNGLGRAFNLGPWRTLLASSALMAVGDLRWVHIAASAGLENPSFSHTALIANMLRGAVGLVMTNTYINVSIVFGFLVMVCAVAFYLFSLRAKGNRRTILVLAIGAMMGYLAAATESWFAALAAVLCVDIGARVLLAKRIRYADALRIAGAAGVMALLAIVSPGILFARVFGGVQSELSPAFRGSRLFQVPPGMVYGKAEWVPLLESDFLWFMVVALCLFALTFYYVWRTHDHVSWLFLLFSVMCFGAFLLLTVEFARDMWRFAQAGTASLAFVSGLAAVWCFSQAVLGSTLAKRLAAILLALITFVFTFGFVLYSLTLPWLADPRPPATYRLDVEAVRGFLIRNIDFRERILVVGGAERWSMHPDYALDLEGRWLSALVAAYSGQFYPAEGVGDYSIDPIADSLQIKRVSAAQGTLSMADLRALEITYLYASGPRLSRVQHAALAEKLARGSLERVWHADDSAQPRSCRAFLRLDESATANVNAMSFSEEERVALPGAPLRLPLPHLGAAADNAGSGANGQDSVQATFLLTVSEPTTVRIETGKELSMRIVVEDALAMRTPPLDSGSTLTLRTEAGTVRVLWLEVYAPIGPHGATYLPEHLELCGETHAVARG